MVIRPLTASRSKMTWLIWRKVVFSKRVAILFLDERRSFLKSF